MKTIRNPKSDTNVANDHIDTAGFDLRTCDKKNSLFTVLASILTSTSLPDAPRPMPLSLDNNLPCITIDIGGHQPHARTEKFNVLIDSCAAMNIGNLATHQWVITNHPHTVAEYLEYTDEQPFEPLQLQGAINTATTPNQDIGKLTAIVRYFTPFTHENGTPILLSFGLGRDISVRAIIGVPTLKSWGSAIHVGDSQLRCPTLNKTFPLSYMPVTPGLPDGINFTAADFRRPSATSTIMLLSANIFSNTTAPPPMPLDLDNSLPGVRIEIGMNSQHTPNFLAHIDTCAAMNTGNLLLHQWIITTYPQCVAEYIEHTDNDPFQPIQMQVAVDDPNSLTTPDIGKLTAVVRYHTPYTFADGSPMLLSFGLGVDVAVRSLIGLPTLRQLACTVDLPSNQLVCPAIKCIFPLLFEPSRMGLPSHIQFTTADFQRPGQSSHFNNDLIAITDGSYSDILPPAEAAAVHSISTATTSALSNPITPKGRALIIEVPIKVWRPKMENRYKPLEYSTDIDDGMFDYTHYGKTVYKPRTDWTNHRRTDLISYNPASDKAELEQGLRISPRVSPDTRTRIITLIQKYWDCFAKIGCRRTIIGYEFAIDTGSSPPVCCRKPQYGPRESAVIMEQLGGLLKNDWIEECEGPWGSQIVLAPKPHQESIEDIEDFIWRMCVSYRGLNKVTKPFEYPIPRCDDAITMIIVGENCIYIITVDAKQGYHQVTVYAMHREKLAFFAPNNRKYTFKVMPFGPMNAPAFYTCMMQDFRKEWHHLFLTTIRDMDIIGGQAVHVTDTDEIFIDGKKTYTDSKGIIDDILAYSTNLELVLIYFECICKVFQKYRVSFRLDKCEFLKDRVEFVGHDILPSGRSPAHSKFKMITDWPTPTSSQTLGSFIGLINFYHNYVPYFEIRLKPLRKLYRTFFRKAIPAEAWTTELKQLFYDLKLSITSPPVLGRYNPDHPVFLKTDWSAHGMGWILMQPADDDASKEALVHLQETGECLFELDVGGARLQPIEYGSRACTDMERKFHSFVGESGAGRWAIGQNRQYLWGNHFYWMCDCKAVEEVLEYAGNIAMVQRWAQELLGYHFTVIHRKERMMIDVDALTRRFGEPIATYVCIATILKRLDKAQRPTAYDAAQFKSKPPVRMRSTTPTNVVAVPTLTTSAIHKLAQQSPPVTLPLPPPPIHQPSIQTSPILVCSATPAPIAPATAPCPTSFKQIEAIEAIEMRVLCINDVIGSMRSWVAHSSTPPILWKVTNVFTSLPAQRIYNHIFDDNSSTLGTLPTFNATVPHIHTYHSLDLCYIPSKEYDLDSWIDVAFHFIKKLINQPNSELVYGTIWFNRMLFAPCNVKELRATCGSHFQSIPNWSVSVHVYKLSSFGVHLDSSRIAIQLSHLDTSTLFNNCNRYSPAETTDADLGFTHVIDAQYHHTAQTYELQNNPFSSLSSVAQLGAHQPLPARFTHPALSSSDRSSVLDPAFPGIEPSTSCPSQFFGNRFGVPFQGSNKIWYCRPLATSELLQLYGHSPTNISNPALLFTMDRVLDQTLRFSIPVQMRNQILTSSTESPNIADSLVTSCDAITSVTQCFTTISSTQPATPIFDWTAAYDADKDTRAMLQHLHHNDPHQWPKSTLSEIDPKYHIHLQRGHIQILNDRLTFFKPILMESRYIALIVVPTTLRRKIFSHYHASPSGGHMGVYKTLYRLRSRFFWPRMREDIKEWVAKCAHCVSYHIWRNRKSELYFSWPITAPFWIMHVDLWSPGTAVKDKQGRTGYLMNTLCDLTQFIISTPTFNITAVHLAKLFMENVFLTFGTCAVIVVDDGSNFKGTFSEMCSSLNITLWCIARGNHKGNSVERYHRFLNKTQTITGNDRGNHQNFVENAKTSQYAWNSAPIDDTDIPRSVAAVGRAFKFPLDADISATPTLNSHSNSGLYNYLRHVSSNATFAQNVLKILIEERRLRHRDRHNQSINHTQQFQVNDIVKAHVQIQSNSDNGTVKKLSYQVRGPFKIVEDLGHNSFHVQRLDNPDGALRKYKGTELYMLPPALFPTEPLDTPDHRYLNYKHAPIVHPLKKALKIEMYNDTYFKTKPPILKPATDSPCTKIDEHLLIPHTNRSIPTTAQLHSETNTTPHPIHNKAKISNEHVPKSDLHHSIQASNDKLFMIAYTPEGTMTARWYLVQVDIAQTIEINPQYQTNNKYYCVFLAKHSGDRLKSDEYSRWWPEWWSYSKDDQEIITYEKRYEFPPTTTPHYSKFIQWADIIDLSSNNMLIGPVNFQPISPSNNTRSTISTSHWQQCHDICIDRNMLPPTLGSQSANKPSKHHQNKKRKRNKSEHGAKVTS